MSAIQTKVSAATLKDHLHVGTSLDSGSQLIASGGCGHTCTNIEGSFQCSCMDVYALAADGLLCECTPLYK